MKQLIKNKEKQLDLYGEEHEQHNKQSIYYSICFKYNIYWEKKNRIWETLKYFYTSKANSKQVLYKIYTPEISMNSINTHLNKLRKAKMIRLIAQGVGRNKSENYFEITSKGIKLYDGLLDEFIEKLK